MNKLISVTYICGKTDKEITVKSDNVYIYSECGSDFNWSRMHKLEIFPCPECNDVHYLDF